MTDGPDSTRQVDIVVVGGGPVGLAAAILARRAAGAGARVVVLEKGALCNSVVQFPTHMAFFSIGRNIEIAGHPLAHVGSRPTRAEALAYYGRVAEVERLDVRTFTRVTAIEPQADGGFRLHLASARPGDGGATSDDVKDGGGQELPALRARFVIVATGYFDQPDSLGVPGETLPHVARRYTEASYYWGQRVVIVGGSNSAVETALDLWYGGAASVTVVHRGSGVRPSVKYWLQPDFENRVAEGSIAVHFDTTVREITPTAVHVQTPAGPEELPADFVLVFIGFRATDSLLRVAGAAFDETDTRPALSPAFETTIPGLFVVGSAGFGTDTRSVFIENGRNHAALAAAEIGARVRTDRDS